MTDSDSTTGSDSRQPDVSVVIPFGCGTDLLETQLSALLCQDYGGEVEILVACNVEVVDPARLNLPVIPSRVGIRYIDATKRSGPSYARNVGWSKSGAEVVLFCDSDDKVDKSWISAMVEATANAAIVGGRLSYTAFNDPDHASWNKQTTMYLPRKFDHLQFVPSSNLGVRREVLVKLDGFDESLTCGEDIDFCWRAQYEGFALAFAPNAVVEYRLRQDCLSLWKQSVNYGSSDAPLFLKHRRFGARRPLRETITEAAAIIWALASMLVRPKRIKKVIVRAGMLAGRVRGSIRHRSWVV